MLESSPAQGTLKRLIEAEEQAREILKAAGESAQGTIAQAQEQATRSLEAVRQDTAGILRSRLEQAESTGATEMKRRMEQVEVEGREIELLAKEHFSDAVEMVVDWVTSGAID